MKILTIPLLAHDTSICVLDNGKISEQGSFASLKNEPGFFSETYKKQTSILGE